MRSKMNKKGKPHEPGSSLTDKIRLSLVLKLNLRMLAMLISGFFSINILLCLLSFGITLWKVETGAREIIDAYGIRENITREPYVTVSGYKIKSTTTRKKAFSYPASCKEGFLLAFRM